MYENTNPDSIELLTSETFEGEDQGMAGTETIFAASFRAIGNCEGSAALIFKCAASETAVAEYTRVMQLETSPDNKIRIASVEEIEPYADWCETTNDGEVLTVRMPSADWKFEIVNPDVVSLITCDSSTGEFVASFMATMERAGFGEIVFTSDDGLNSRTVNVFANEGGTLSVEDASTFKIFYAPNLVYCNACGGWFEEGAEFDTHTCVTPEADPTPVDFQTVSVTGNSVNMREDAGVNYASIRVLKKGNHAKYLGEKTKDERGVEWYKVSYNGRTGWVSSKYGKISTSTTAPKTTDDMRLVYNPNRYDVIRVSDIFSQDGRTYYIDCCFGRIGKDGDPEKFDASKTVRLVLNPGAEVLLPADLDNLQDLSYVDDPAIWFANACKQIGSSFKFYATFSMNEGGAIRSLAYLYVD